MKTIALFSLMIGCANTSDDTGASIDETNTTAETADEETAEESEEDKAKRKASLIFLSL